MWKVIVSPEQAQRLDLRAHTRELIVAMESDLGTRLEWAAIDHHNTAHPHVHVVVRGVRDDARVLSSPTVDSNDRGQEGVSRQTAVIQLRVVESAAAE